MSPDRDSGTPWILWAILVIMGSFIGCIVSDMDRTRSALAEESTEASRQYNFKAPQFERVSELNGLSSTGRHDHFFRENVTGLCFVSRDASLAPIPCEAMELARIQEVADGSAPR